MKENGTRKLFGTDGVRGVANREPITAETALRLGRAIAFVVRQEGRQRRVLIGKDTRLSGYMLETALAAGIVSEGVDVLLAGPLPTPAIAFLTRSLRADAGVVISASHNPYEDNGIKFFAHTGFKLPDELEHRLERLVLETTDLEANRPTGTGIGKAFRIDDAVGRYNEFLKNTFPRHRTLDGLKIAFDGANGAAYKVGPEILSELGARLVTIGDHPDGRNINDGCGALHPDRIADVVRESGCDVGIAVDGDADRATLVDEKGDVVDGDQILAMMATERLRQGNLPGRVVVTTIMGNLGLVRAVEAAGGRVVRSPVGDRYVVEEMVRSGAILGAEPSGHVVFLERATTGDGLLTALQVLALMTAKEKPLSALRRVMTPVPQVQRNVRVARKIPLEELPRARPEIERAERALGQEGRVIVRYSGTEPLVRVMVEGDNASRIGGFADVIAAALREDTETPASAKSSEHELRPAGA